MSAVRSLRRMDWRIRSCAASSSRSVTRGESIHPSQNPNEQKSPRAKNAQKTKIDWLSCSFLGDGLEVLDVLRGVRPFLTTEIIGQGAADQGFGGFSQACRLSATLKDGSQAQIGVIAWGGVQQRGRWMFQLNGKGCGLVSDWSGLRGFLSSLINVRLTRVDIAADFLGGEYTVDDALTLYEDGRFISRGRNPQIEVSGDWVGEENSNSRGRTVYIGKTENGKRLCVYEKGKQLKMKGEGSDWVRYEVRLGNRDRETIPLEVLTEPDKFFRGAYPAIADMLEGAAETIPTIAKEAQANLAHGLFHASRCYGKYFHQALNVSDCDFSDLVQEVRIVGIPSKVEPIGVIQGVSWEDLRDEIRQHKKASRGF